MSDKTLKQKQQRQDKEKQAYAFYVAQGWTPEQSIGIIGNIKRESGFNPNAIGDAGKAFGLAQWHPDRQAKAKSLYGNNWKSFENQLKFIDWELKNTEKVAGDKLKASKGIWEAGKIVSDSYERPKVKFSGDEKRQTHVADLAMKFKGVKLTPEDMPYFDASYANSVAPYMNQTQETITPAIKYFDIPKETTTFASVPDSAEEDKKETVEDGVTSKDVAEVEQKTKEYNFLEELQKEDYSHLQPEQVAQQQTVPQVDFNQQYEQVSQFIDEPLVVQQGGSVKQDNEWLKNWYTNRVIPNKDVQGAYLEDKPIYTERLKNIPLVTKVNMIDNNPQKTGQYQGDTGKILMTPTAQPSVYTHEVNHYLNDFPSTMRTVHENVVEQNMYKKGDSRLGGNNEYYDYLRNPDEIHSRVQVLRKDAGFKPNEEVTQDKLLKYLQNYKGSDENILQLMNLTDEKGLLEMLNYMAETPKNKEKQYVAQQGLTWQEKLANRPKKPTVAEIIAEGDARKAQQRAQTDNIPNTKRDLSLMLAEHNNIKKDEQELRTTGQIKNPNSIQYRRNVKTQPDIKQDDISTEQRNAQLNPLERPLIYLANPSKLLGDIGIPNMETSELDRQAISSNRFNPNQTRTQRLENQVKLGLGYVPEATVNTALAASFMPEGSGALGLVNEALNPLAGIGTNSTGQFVNNLANPLAGTGDLINNLGNKYLPNAYKLNPNAFKPNPEAYYRVIGEAGYKDAIENNIIRPKINSIHSINYPTFKKGVPLDNRYASSEIKGLIGDNSYIVESNGNKMVQNNWTAAAPDKDIFLPRRELKAENEGINFYKKDWLQGYKQVEVPKEELIDLYRIQQKGAETFAERAKNGNLHRFFNNPETLARKAEEEKYFGRWFTTDKNDLDWYLKDREFTNPEYIHTQVPKSKLSQYNIENFDKTLSRAPEREFILPQELIDRGKRYTDISQFQQGGHIPIAGASYLATQGQEEPKKLQQGGEFSENELAFLSEIAIKDNNGYWNKNNHGKVVEIEGGNITMKNVDQDLIGIGINKKGKKTEQKTMKAGKNYNFDKAIKVIEIPLFKK